MDDFFYDDPPLTLKAEFDEAFRAWSQQSRERRMIERETSIGAYRVLWESLARWCVVQSSPVGPRSLTPADLQNFLDRPTERDAVAIDKSPRHVWRLLTLTDRVLAHHASLAGSDPNPSARELLHSRPEWRHANAAINDPQLDYLNAAQSRYLVEFLSRSRPRPGRNFGGKTWQELRNAASVALQLGAGVTPGEVRAMTLSMVITDGGKNGGLPWKLLVPPHGGNGGRETPLAPWAARLLLHWLETREQRSIPGQQLFPSTATGKPWSKVSQYLAVRQVIEAAGLDPRLFVGGSFRLRHTFALRQLRRGHSDETVARWLGIEPAEIARYRRIVFTPPSDVV